MQVREEQGTVRRSILIAGFVSCLALSLCVPVRAQVSRQYEYKLSLEALPIGKATVELSRQTGRQTGLAIAYYPSRPGEESAIIGPLAAGRYSVEAALQSLLKPRGFTFEWVDERTINIVSPPAPPRSSVAVSPASTAKAEPRARHAGQRPAVMRSVDNSGSATGADSIEIIWVTGTRLAGARDHNASSTVFDRRRLADLGVSNVADLLKYVPQQPFVRPEGYRMDGVQSAGVRGIGLDMTLVLVNGRRMAVTATSLAVNTFDLNSIPLPAVERVEVLSDSAAAVYGADAIGGVINIILTKDIPDPRASLMYGAANDGATERRASLAAGHVTERFKGSAVLDFYSRDPLFGRARDRWRDQDYTRFGGTDWRSPAAAPGNVMSLTPGNLPGLSAPFAAVPEGSTGVGLSPEDFAATAGQRNVHSPFSYWSIVPQSERRSAVAQADFQLSRGTAAFGELLYVDESTSYQIDPPPLLGALVPASNPFNPFGVPVLVSTMLDAGRPRLMDHESELIRVAAGLRGQVRTWEWEVAVVESREDALSRLDNELNMARVNAALAAADPAHSLNVFSDGAAGTAQALASLVAEPKVSRYVSDSKHAAALTRGPLFDVPAGQASVVVGAEWREEEVLYDVAAMFGSPKVFGAHDRSVKTAFAELRIPLMNASMGIPLMRELALTVAARYDDYTNVGDSFNPQYGISWRPVTDIALHGSFARGFRPPSLFELFAPRAPTVIPVADPRRNNQTTSIGLLSGGNPDLDASEAESLTAGIVFAPRQAPGLHMAASYWRISMDHRVAIVPASVLLAHEDNFASRIVRAPPTPADIAAGLPGQLVLIDASRLNFGKLETSGIDFTVAYTRQTRFGQLTPTLSATWVDEFRTRDLPGAQDVDRVGVADRLGTITDWRAVAGLTWSFGRIGLSTFARYVASYEDATPAGRTGRIIPSQTLVDAQFSLDLGELLGAAAPWKDFELRLGATNVFDKEPPFAEVGGLSGYDLSQGDLKQRFMYVKLLSSF